MSTENSFLSDWSVCSRFSRGAGHNLRHPVEVRELSEDRQRPAHLQSSNCLRQLPVRVRLRPARLCPEFRQAIPEAHSTRKERTVLIFLALKFWVLIKNKTLKKHANTVFKRSKRETLVKTTKISAASYFYFFCCFIENLVDFRVYTYAE